MIPGMLTTILWLALAGLSSVLIWKASDPFSDASHFLGRNIPESVRGATIDAVASSLPEFFATFFFLFVYDQFSSGVGTIAGSAIYNILVIPGLCALIAKNLTVTKDVVWRDGVFYVLSQLILVGFLMTGHLTWYMGATLLLVYLVYVWFLHRHAKNHENSQEHDDYGKAPGGKPWTNRRAWLVLLVSTLVVAAACQLLVTSTVELAVHWAVPAYFVAVILAAAATSVPDTAISVHSTLKGDHSGALSNAFGSNVFDIDVGLGLPLLLYTSIHGRAIPIQGRGIAHLWLVLIGASLASLLLVGSRYRITRKKGLIMIALYGGFVAYAVVHALQ